MISIPFDPAALDTKVLGRGSFCDVVESVDPATSDPVAVKYAKRKEHGKLLAQEAETMRRLANCQSTLHTGIPKLIDDSHCTEFIVMQKVGRTLLDLQNELKQFSLKTIVMVAVKAITALEEIHSCGIVHRDVKPDNVAIPLSPSDPRILFIDLGLSSKYVIGGTHVTYSEKTKFQGTPFFCSLNALKNIKPTRRDDLEALGYLLVYLSLGSLPWFEGDPSSPDFFVSVLHTRESISTSLLCKGLEPEFQEYIHYCQNLGFNEKPNYDLLRAKFTRLAQRFGFTLDWQYDWSTKARKRGSKMTKSFSANTEISSQGKSSRSNQRTRPSTESSVGDLNTVRTKKKPGAIVTGVEYEVSIDKQVTPVHRIDQLPAFRRPREDAVERQETEEVDIKAIVLPMRLRH